MKEVEIALLLPPILSLLVERRRKYRGGKLEVSSGHSFVVRPHVRACERVRAGTSWARARRGIGARQHGRWLGLAWPSRVEKKKEKKNRESEGEGRKTEKGKKYGKRKLRWK